MTAISIIGSDNREITTAFNTFPINAVTAIDSQGIFANQVQDSQIIGSGIVVAPNHVLTAGHNAYSFDARENYQAIRVTISSKQNDLTVRGFSGGLGRGASNLEGGTDPDANAIDEII